MSLRKMHGWGGKSAGRLTGALLLAAVLCVPTLAQGPAGGPPPPGQGPPPPGAPPAPGGKGLAGRITAVSSGSITVKNRQGTTATFTIGDGAKITLDGKTVDATGLGVGEFASVFSADGTTTTQIDASVHPPRPAGPPPAKVTAVTDTSLTIQPPGRPARTFTLTSATTYTKDGQPAQASDLVVGLYARIRSTDGQTATAVEIHTKAPPPGGPPPPDGGQGGPPPPDGGPGGPPPPDGNGPPPPDNGQGGPPPPDGGGPPPPDGGGPGGPPPGQ